MSELPVLVAEVSGDPNCDEKKERKNNDGLVCVFIGCGRFLLGGGFGSWWFEERARGEVFGIGGYLWFITWFVGR